MKIKGSVLMKLGLAVMVLSGVVIMSSCEKYRYLVETVNPTDTVYFQADIQPIFNAGCLNCHGTLRDPDLRNGHAYEALISGGYIAEPAEASLIYTKLLSGSHATYVSDADRQKILYWIKQGAEDN